MVKSVNVGILESERQDDVQQTNVFSTKLITRHITRKFFFTKLGYYFVSESVIIIFVIPTKCLRKVVGEF